MCLRPEQAQKVVNRPWSLGTADCLHSKYRQDLLQPQPRRDEPEELDSEDQPPPVAAPQLPRSESPVEETRNFDRIAKATLFGFPEWDVNLLCSMPTPSNSSQSEEPPPFPYYIKPLLGSTSLDTLASLSSEGVFQIPPIEVVKEYFQSYVRWMHPMVPVLDLSYCLDSLLKPESGKQISVLLFYAIMLVASAFVDETHLQALNFESRIPLRREMFKRAQACLPALCHYFRHQANTQRTGSFPRKDRR